jgi:uncharacterized membrane protein YGL010W
MVKGRILLGYDDKPKNKKKLKYSDWLIILISSSPIWLTLLLVIVVAVSVFFLASVIAFIAVGFSSVMLFVYSAFQLLDDLWPSVLKMGACLFTSGVTIIFVAFLFRGFKEFFILIKKGYVKTKKFLMLKKLEGQKDEQNP